MHLLFITRAFTQDIVNAICWTLIHSLWQGFVVAVFAGIIIMLTKYSKAAVRYNLLSVLFFSFLLIVMITFFTELNQNEFAGLRSFFTSLALRQSDVSIEDHRWFTINAQNLIAMFVDYLNRYADIAVFCWFSVCTIKSLKICAGIKYLQKLRTTGITQPPANWNNRIIELSLAIGLNRPVKLMESCMIKVPGAIDLLRPFILVPVGLFAYLPPDQAEAILLHELAHIKRKDYFINIIQSFVEVVFFFNPAVLWLSSLMKAERENCCDDTALMHIKSRKRFIEALVHFHEWNCPSFAMSFMGTRSGLLNRVIRIANNKNKVLSGIEMFLLVLSVVSILFLASDYTTNTTADVLKKHTPDHKQKTDDNRFNELQNNVLKDRFLKKAMLHIEETDRTLGAHAGEPLLQKEKVNKQRVAIYKTRLVYHAPENKKKKNQIYFHRVDEVRISSTDLKTWSDQINEREGGRLSVVAAAARKESDVMKQIAQEVKIRSDKMKEEHFKMKREHDKMKSRLDPINII